MWSNLEKSFNIHFLWLNNSNPQQFYMCNSKKMKTMINFTTIYNQSPLPEVHGQIVVFFLFVEV